MAPEEHFPEREARLVQMLRQAAGAERAPLALKQHIENLRAQAEYPRRVRMLGVPVRTAGMATAMIVAIAVALVVTLGGGGVDSPSIAHAAAIAARGPATLAPGPDPNAPVALLAASVGGLHFPNWQSDGGWRATGERTDALGHHAVTTVYYKSGQQQIAYSIVSSPTLIRPDGYGEPYATFLQDGRTVVVWEERGHTCLLSAAGMSADRLWSLAVSTGDV